MYRALLHHLMISRMCGGTYDRPSTRKMSVSHLQEVTRQQQVCAPLFLRSVAWVWACIHAQERLVSARRKHSMCVCAPVAPSPTAFVRHACQTCNHCPPPSNTHSQASLALDLRLQQHVQGAPPRVAHGSHSHHLPAQPRRCFARLSLLHAWPAAERLQVGAHSSGPQQHPHQSHPRPRMLACAQQKDPTHVTTTGRWCTAKSCGCGAAVALMQSSRHCPQTHGSPACKPCHASACRMPARRNWPPSPWTPAGAAVCVCTHAGLSVPSAGHT